MNRVRRERGEDFFPILLNHLIGFGGNGIRGEMRGLDATLQHDLFCSINHHLSLGGRKCYERKDGLFH